FRWGVGQFISAVYGSVYHRRSHRSLTHRLTTTRTGLPAPVHSRYARRTSPTRDQSRSATRTTTQDASKTTGTSGPVAGRSATHHSASGAPAASKRFSRHRLHSPAGGASGASTKATTPGQTGTGSGRGAMGRAAMAADSTVVRRGTHRRPPRARDRVARSNRATDTPPAARAAASSAATVVLPAGTGDQTATSGRTGRSRCPGVFRRSSSPEDSSDRRRNGLSPGRAAVSGGIPRNRNLGPLAKMSPISFSPTAAFAL